MTIRLEVFGYTVARVCVECDLPPAPPPTTAIKKVSKWWINRLVR